MDRPTNAKTVVWRAALVQLPLKYIGCNVGLCKVKPSEVNIDAHASVGATLEKRPVIARYGPVSTIEEGLHNAMSDAHRADASAASGRRHPFG